MEPYRNNLFYNSEPVFKRLNEFKKEVQERAYAVKLEVKYEKKSGARAHRKKTDKNLDYILDLVTKIKLKSGIKDPGQIRILHVMPNFDEKERFQIVFNFQNDEGWYFAWFDLELQQADYFVEKYKLKIIS